MFSADPKSRIVESESNSSGRFLYLPLEKIVKCSNKECGKSSSEAKLKVCSACGEVLYCSNECQKADWKAHKSFCGQTDRIDLESFYPILAVIHQLFHTRSDIPQHPALTRRIENDPMSPESVVQLPNGVGSRLVLLGDLIIHPTDVGSQKWWPTARSDRVRSKLFRRIINEGMVLPTVVASAIALVSELYTTTAIPKEVEPKFQTSGRRRVRLSYNHSPIADIGIVHGSVRVTNGDRLAYYDFESDRFLMGQDPQDHYWMYFKTLAGNEYFLDCGMMNFNFCFMVDVSKHCEAMGLMDLAVAPAYFYNREQEKAFPMIDQLLFRPKKKISILRDKRLSQLGIVRSFEVTISDADVPIIRTFMDEITERKCTEYELEMALKFIPDAIRLIRNVVQKRAYISLPKSASIGIDMDPEEEKDASEGEEELSKYLMKWSRRLKRGDITPEKWLKAFWNYTEGRQKR